MTSEPGRRCVDGAACGRLAFRTNDGGMPRPSRRRRLPLLLAAALAATGCAGAQADEDSLRDSFARQIADSHFVTDFARDGDTLRFEGPDGDGGTAAWQVRIETALVEENEFDPVAPYQGRIMSEWIADGEVVEYLGNMTALPQAFLDRGIGQECWAYWIASERRWDW